METIKVENLTKIFQIYQKEPGLIGTFKSLIHRRYEQIRAIDNISFKIEEGELVGFIGPNGAGKTTTLKCLSGLLYPTSGNISVLNFTPWQRKSEFLRQIAFVMGQKNQLWWDLPAMDTFLLNKEIYEINDRQFKTILDELSDLLEAKDILKIPVKKLSLGQRMKCELIAALLHKPAVLFLDEPTIGLDVVMQKKLREFIRGYNKKFGATVILTSHYMADVEALAKRIIVINHGKLLFDGKLKDLVKKYAPDKFIRLVLKEYVPKENIEKIGKIKSYNFPQLVLIVPTKDLSNSTATVLRQFPVADLNIEDAQIEDVIRKVFTKYK
jgi:ABC-2 type transport system ATP-binding protein